MKRLCGMVCGVLCLSIGFIQANSERIALDFSSPFPVSHFQNLYRHTIGAFDAAQVCMQDKRCDNVVDSVLAVSHGLYSMGQSGELSYVRLDDLDYLCDIMQRVQATIKQLTGRRHDPELWCARVLAEKINKKLEYILEANQD